jgi:ABC-2 type transport system permease protein
MSVFKDIWGMVKRELDIIASDGSVMLTIFIAPLLYIFLLGTIYMAKDINSVNMAVVDMDQTQLSRTYVRFMESSEKVHVSNSPNTFEEAQDLMFKFDVFGVLVIPKGFEKDVMTLKGTDVALYLNNSRFLMSNEINKTVQKISLMVGAGVRLKYFEMAGTNPREAMEIVMPVKPEINFLNNIFNNYGYFLLPGLLFLIIQQTLLLGLGESVSLEREEGLIKSWLKPERSILTSIIGKNLFYFVLYLAYPLLLATTIFPFFGLPLHGDAAAITLLVVLFVTSMILFTNLVASFFNKQVVYMEIIAFTSYPIFLITGYAWPRYALLDFYVWISYILPTTPFMESMIKLTQQNVNLSQVTNNYIVLLVQIMVFYLLLTWRLTYLRKKNMEEEKTLASLN